MESPPFEVTEQGWGEFEIHVQVYFHSTTESKPLELSHLLKLYPDGEVGPQPWQRARAHTTDAPPALRRRPP